MEEDIVIVGGGIAGLATALGLHRLGLKSMVLEAAGEIRATGFGLMSWNNTWKALDTLGVGHLLRPQSTLQRALVVTSARSGNCTSEISLNSSQEGRNHHESRCLQRSILVRTLANELPEGTIRFSSKLVCIQESPDHCKILRLADGSVLKTKAVIGCDGINSVVGRWLGLKTPCSCGRYAIWGYVRSRLEHKVAQFMGDGVKYGVVPMDQSSLYWFFTFSPSNSYERGFEQDPVKMKDYVLSKLGEGSEIVRELVKKTRADEIVGSPLRMRLPWELVWGDIAKGNVCVAGDAFHPMTPDLGQGASSSLEDGVVLARCLGKALQGNNQVEDRVVPNSEFDSELYIKIERALEEYAMERRLRAFSLITTSYVVGFVEQTKWRGLQVLRDNVLSSYLNGLLLKMGEYNCGELV